MWKQAYLQISKATYAEINDVEFLKRLSPEIGQFITKVQALRIRMQSSRALLIKLFMETCEDTIPFDETRMAKGAARESAITFMNRASEWYKLNAMAGKFSNANKIQFLISSDDTVLRSTNILFWQAVYSHLLVVSKHVEPYFREFNTKVEFGLSLLDERMAKMMEECNFMCAWYLGDQYTEFCYAILAFEVLFSSRQPALCYVVYSFLLILNSKYNGKVPYWKWVT